jgi:hypothetical protein
VIEINNLLRRVAECHEISGMNENVPIGHAQFGGLAVRVANAYNADRRHRSTLL